MDSEVKMEKFPLRIRPFQSCLVLPIYPTPTRRQKTWRILIRCLIINVLFTCLPAYFYRLRRCSFKKIISIQVIYFFFDAATWKFDSYVPCPLFVFVICPKSDHETSYIYTPSILNITRLSKSFHWDVQSPCYKLNRKYAQA